MLLVGGGGLVVMKEMRDDLFSKFQHQSHLRKYFITINSPDF